MVTKQAETKIEKRETKELNALKEISNAISSSLDLTTVMEHVLDVLHKHLGMERGTIAILETWTGKPEARKGELSIQVASGMDLDSVRRGHYKIGEGIMGKVVEFGEPIVVPNVGREPLFLNKTKTRDLTKNKIAFICVPINLGKECVGALSVDRLFPEEKTLKQDTRLLTIISAMIGQAVQIQELIRKDKELLTNENQRLKRELKKKFHPVNIIGESKRMSDVFASIDLVARTRANVILRGESGTGKELVARAVHYYSERAEKPFIKVACAALPETLLESELFGHEKGAFTGAQTSRKGRFELADTGTLFLDEIGDISPSMQVKLLRVLQEREFERLGGSETIRVDVRIISATNLDLEKAMKEGNFREDLYYRLNVVPIFLPSLRERKEDITFLAQHFLKKSCEENGFQPKRISDDAWEYMMDYAWPGNVRELENSIERAVIMCKDDLIERSHFPLDLQANINPIEAKTEESSDTNNLPVAVEELEKRLIGDALAKSGGNKRKAARLLGLTERMIGYKAKRYELA